MTEVDFERVRVVFLAARDLDAAARDAMLRRACGADDALRAEVESLLTHHDSARERVTTPVAGAALDALVRGGASDDRLPRDFGPFELLAVVGRGGMGAVYRARQRTPDRIVAVKVIRPGMVSESMMQRFRYEADVLARLQHPGIAQIFEAGTVEADGVEQPYFALELVAGEPIDRYVTTHDLDVRARLAILVKVCEAVHHAHRKGVIHRDLKPGNILVDADGQPKVLDFGVARLTGADVRATTLRTGVGQLVGTLPYMSPEQVSGDPSRLDVRSDVYALGVLAFELLTGRLPYDLDDKTITDAALTIRDTEAPRLGTLAPALRGDLETITAKTLDKEPGRRYDSAAALAEDLRRHLTHQPINARPPSMTYKLRLFARRHRTLVAGGTVGVVALVLATVVSVGFVVNARRAGTRETKQREIADRTNAYLEDVLEAANPHRVGAVALSPALLDHTVAKLEAGAEPPEVEARVRSTIGTTYLDLRRTDDAIVQLGRAVALWRAIEPAGSSYAHALGALATARVVAGDTEAAERAYLEVIPILVRLGETDNLDRTYRGLLDLLVKVGKYAEAETIARSVLDDARRDGDPVKIIATLRRVARIDTGLGAHDRAAHHLREARTLAETHLAERHPMYNAVLLDLSVARRAAGDLDDALAASRDAYTLALRTRQPDTRDWMVCVETHADLLETLDRRDELLDLLTRARASLVAAFDANHERVRAIDARLARLHESD